jgi:hypothetical protein
MSEDSKNSKTKEKADSETKPRDFSAKTKWELQAEEDDIKRAKIDSTQRRLFDPIKLTENANKIHEEEDPELGFIKYGELTLYDAFTIEKCKSDQDKSSMAVYLMLKKANPGMAEYTPENIVEWQRTMPMAEGAMLLLFIRRTPAFLRTQSMPGLAKTVMPKR